MGRSGGILRAGQVRRRSWRAASVIVVTVGITAGGIIGTTPAVPVGSPAAAQAREVIGDDERDMFIGTGSLILPVSMSSSGRESAADCPGCSWKATLVCDPVSPTACRGQARLCPNDHLWLRISVRRPSSEWQIIGSDCFTPGGPVTRVRLEGEIHQRLEQGVPALRPTRWPRRGVLPHLPVAFDTGQESGPRSWTWDILGLPVTVVAQPRWSWQFEIAGAIVTTRGASGAPRIRGWDAHISHVYRSAGTREVSVWTTWTATFAVPGLSAKVVPGTVQQRASLTVSVGQARAVLTR